MSGRREIKTHGVTRSCEFCRARKVRCDAQKPSCGSCCRHKRECVYVCQARKARPTRAMVNQLRAENERLEGLIQRLTQSNDSKIVSTSNPSYEAQTAGLNHGEELRGPSSTPSPAMSSSQVHHQPQPQMIDDQDRQETEEPALDVSPYLWADEKGNLNAFGPSSALQSGLKPQDQSDSVALVHVQNGLLASAVMSRQQEHRLLDLAVIDGVPIELAAHLLELHWNRQHHTFLLTYRPAIMRDLVRGGPFASNFLINAIFACASKFSRRRDVLDHPDDPSTAGGRFFRRCDELIESEHLLLSPSVPTITGLLLLGSTYNAKGSTSKAWMLTGSALRMIYDLGLHLDHKITQENAEEVEIGRRVFWGAFICDKLQSLYLGRPVAIRLHDAHVSHELNDIMEENELWVPYIDSSISEGACQPSLAPHGSIHSVSCFQHLCFLFKIVARIIDNFYVVGATPARARAALKGIDAALNKWEAVLPNDLCLDPACGILKGGRRAAPNVLALHLIYNAVIVLLHRPLVAEGHLTLGSTAPAASWKRCSVAARNITNLAVAYRSGYTLRAAPYLISYSVYVACTIHVRNAAVVGERKSDHSTLLVWSLRCLEELSVPNPGVTQPIAIIKKLMATKGVEISLESNVTATTELPADNRAEGGENRGMEEFDFPILPSDGYLGEAEFDWNNWHESFHEDVLFGFMGSHSYSFEDIMPEILGVAMDSSEQVIEG